MVEITLKVGESVEISRDSNLVEKLFYSGMSGLSTFALLFRSETANKGNIVVRDNPLYFPILTNEIELPRDRKYHVSRVDSSRISLEKRE